MPRSAKVAPAPPPPAKILQDVAPEELMLQAEQDVLRITDKLAKPIVKQIRRKRKLGIKEHRLPTIKESDEEGAGLKRQAGLLPPAVRSMLSKMGNEKITSIKIVRTPLASYTKILLNVISLGEYEKAVRESPYDEMFHLSLFLNNKYTTDKQAVITLTKSNPIKKDSEVFDLTVSKDMTFNDLFENGRKKMGDDKFSNYDARKNNCQDFLISLLDGSGLLTDQARSFIKQDADEIFRRLPTITEKLAKFITDVGAVADRVIEGEGFEEEWIEIGRGLYQPVRIMKGGEIPEDVKKLAEAKYQLKKATEEYEKALPEKEKPQLLPVYINKPEEKKYTGDEYHKGPFVARKSGGDDTQWTVWNSRRLVRTGIKKDDAIAMVDEMAGKTDIKKKFPGGRKEINEYMKKMSKEYQAKKSKSK